MDKVILFKMIGLVMLVIGVFMFIAGFLFDSKFFKGYGLRGNYHCRRTDLLLDQRDARR